MPGTFKKFLSARRTIQRSDYIASHLRSATWVLVTLLVQLNRWRGCRNSAALWTFWTLTLILR